MQKLVSLDQNISKSQLEYYIKVDIIYLKKANLNVLPISQLSILKDQITY